MDISIVGDGHAILTFPFTEEAAGKLVLWSKPVSVCVDHKTLLWGKPRVVVEDKDVACWVPRVLSCELMPGRVGHTSLVLLEEGSTEYSEVKWRYYQSVAGGGRSGHQLLSIMRVQAPEQLERYCTHRAHVAESLAREGKKSKTGVGKDLEKHLWHGPSTVEALRGILVRGFDRFMSKTSAWGRGVYFTKDVWYAEDYAASPFSAIDDASVKVVLLENVCVGEACVGSRNLYPPPLKPKSTRHFDSTVNRLEDPSIWVTYNDGQAYPMYVCTFVPPKEEDE